MNCPRCGHYLKGVSYESNHGRCEQCGWGTVHPAQRAPVAGDRECSEPHHLGYEALRGKRLLGSLALTLAVLAGAWWLLQFRTPVGVYAWLDFVRTWYWPLILAWIVIGYFANPEWLQEIEEARESSFDSLGNRLGRILMSYLVGLMLVPAKFAAYTFWSCWVRFKGGLIPASGR